MLYRIIPGLYAIMMSQSEIEYFMFNDKQCELLLIVNPVEVSVMSNFALEFFFENGCSKIGTLVSYPASKIVNAVYGLQQLIPNLITISSSEFSAKLRSGKCEDGQCSPINVSWEIRDRITEVSDEIFTVKLGTPISGTLGVLFHDALVTYEIKSSPFGTTRYICTSRSCNAMENGLRELL